MGHDDKITTPDCISLHIMYIDEYNLRLHSQELLVQVFGFQRQQRQKSKHVMCSELVLNPGIPSR